MKNKSVLFLAGILAASAALSGCGEKKQSASGEAELTCWMPLSSVAASTVSNYGETPFAKKLQEEIGVRINYQHPPQGQETEKFNILMAMNQLPDVIIAEWTDYPGGPDRAISENKILDLTEDIKTKAPDFYKIISEHEDWAKLMKTDSGKIYSFPFIRGDKSLLVSQGLVLREDWLDELGLSVPETIDEWEQVLTAFRDEKDATPLSVAPWHFNSGIFCGAYNPLIYDKSDVISTYVYRLGFTGQQWSYTTAIGLFNSVVNLIFLIAANTISKKLNETSLW